MNERFWSPQMRKWFRDAPRHGKRVYLSQEQAGGFTLLNKARIVDLHPLLPDAIRIVDNNFSPGNLNVFFTMRVRD